MSQKQKIAQLVIKSEQEALERVIDHLDVQFDHAVDAMLHCTSHVIVTGMGKSSHIAKKIASTLSSTGTPSFFIHPSEANHGDMGAVTAANVLLVISNSGETAELLELLHYSKQMGITIIGMSARDQSYLAKIADFHLNIGTKQEACFLGLAPTSSTTACLALGDALAMALLQERDFKAQDFARRHPKGQLGKRLTVKVGDLMHQKDDLPLVSAKDSLKQTLIIMTEKRLGLAVVVDEKQHVLGLFTDGDVRRALNEDLNIHQTPIQKIMTTHYIAISENLLASRALQILKHYKISSLIICDIEQKIRGVLHLHDLLAYGIPMPESEINLSEDICQISH